MSRIDRAFNLPYQTELERRRFLKMEIRAQSDLQRRISSAKMPEEEAHCHASLSGLPLFCGFEVFMK